MKGEGFLTKNISGFTRLLESVVSTDNLCRAPGLLQGLDPRVKIVTFVLFIITVGLARSLWPLAVMFILILVFSTLSKVPLGFFLKRVFLFIPIFAAVIAIPALFITPGLPLATIAGKVIITEQGARTAGLLFLRVTDSLSFGVLLILTTSWNNLLAALRWLRMPALLVDILGMTYRYIFLLLHAANSMFMARRSRTLGSFSSAENRRWLIRALTNTMTKSQYLSEEVYLAMASRGYQGEIRVLNDFKIEVPGLPLGGFCPGIRIDVDMEQLSMNNLNASPVFEAKNLSYSYPGNIPALNQMSFVIGKGELVALVGANGSGKSRLLKFMDGLVFPTDGELLAFGQVLSEKTMKDSSFVMDFRRRVGLVFQDPDVQLFSSTVWDEVSFGPLQLGISKDEVVSRSQEVLELLNIAHLKERPPYLLSGGEKKKVSLASVLSLHPQVLLLDEPTTGLDPRSQGNLIDFLFQWADKEKSMVFSTQDLDIVEEIATRVIVIGAEHNIVADGKPEEYLSDPDFLLRTNLVHEHSHRHKDLIHRHLHVHEREHHPGTAAGKQVTESQITDKGVPKYLEPFPITYF